MDCIFIVAKVTSTCGVICGRFGSSECVSESQRLRWTPGTGVVMEADAALLSSPRILTYCKRVSFASCSLAEHFTVLLIVQISLVSDACKSHESNPCGSCHGYTAEAQRELRELQSSGLWPAWPMFTSANEAHAQMS